MVLPETEYPPGSAERDETKARHDFGSAREVGTTLMLVELIGNEAIPGRYGELAASEVERGTSDDKPRTGLRKQERQEHNGSPGQGLADGADADQRLPVGKPMEQLYRDQLGAGTDQLRQCGQHAELEGVCMQ